MHKKKLGLTSLLMAEMLLTTTVGTGVTNVYAAENESNVSASESEEKEEKSDSSVESESTKEGEDNPEKSNDAGNGSTSEEAGGKSGEKDNDKTSDNEEKKEESNSGSDNSEEAASKEEGVENKDKESKEKDKEQKDDVKKDEEKEDKKEEGNKDEKTIRYSADELDVSFRWGSEKAENGVMKFPSQYYEYLVKIPKKYSFNEIENIKVKMKDQDGKLCFKYYGTEEKPTKEDKSVKETYDNFGKEEYDINIEDDASFTYLGIMSVDEFGEKTPTEFATLVGIEIKLKDDVKKDDENSKIKHIIYTKDDMEFMDTWSKEAYDGGNVLKFEKDWQEYCFKLKEPLNAERINSIKIKVKDQDATVAFKLYDETQGEDGKYKELLAEYGKKGQKEYVLNPSVDGKVTHFAIMAMNSNTYPCGVTIESVEFEYDTTPVDDTVKKGVEYDIPNLRDKMCAVLGDDFIVGTAISYQEFADNMEMELVTKHFNGVTLGNELKPDSMLRKDAELEDVTLNGHTFKFPKLNYETPERYLDFFVKWNNEHPDKKIRIRGHVLVWHNQTPEFFFHEDYDLGKPFVTPEVMNLRLEYYIKSVAQHFTSEGSKYKDMFYGWDVVNEAVSDGTGTYRNDNENSKWWAVYKSPEFIKNAFVYANKYMPKSIALFYNDYNETMESKTKGICQLLTDVKNTEGARIDGMGMQAHYQITSNSPSMEQFKKSARAYGKIVGQVQVTELDFKGSANSKDERLAQRYKDVYDTIRRLRNEGCNITGMTIWGVVDKHSWLQTQNSAGGGSTDNSRQYPLLFDNNYKAKNSFYALADAGELEPEIKSVRLVQMLEEDYSVGENYSFNKDGGNVSFTPMWSTDGLNVKVKVPDNSFDSQDSVTLFASDSDGIKQVTVSRKDAKEVNGGYEAELKLSVNGKSLSSNEVKMDVLVNDNGNKSAFNDTTFNQASSNKFFAETTVKPLLNVQKGSVLIDGKIDDKDWDKAEEVPLTINVGSKVSAKAKLLWDEENLYVLMNVKDDVLNKDSSQNHEQDSIEVFIDENNHKTSSYEDDDKQYRINYENKQSFNGKKCVEENVKSSAVVTKDGYMIEAAFKWTDIKPSNGTAVGLELQINDADGSGKRIGTLSWSDKTGNGWSSTSVYGTICLKDGIVIPPEPSKDTPKEDENKDKPANGGGNKTPSKSGNGGNESGNSGSSSTSGNISTGSDTTRSTSTGSTSTTSNKAAAAKKNTTTVSKASANAPANNGEVLGVRKSGDSDSVYKNTGKVSSRNTKKSSKTGKKTRINARKNSSKVTLAENKTTEEVKEVTEEENLEVAVNEEDTNKEEVNESASSENENAEETKKYETSADTSSETSKDDAKENVEEKKPEDENAAKENEKSSVPVAPIAGGTGAVALVAIISAILKKKGIF
ncbi:endo-1,4-beta-xylanase [Butyrivibrio sp. NC3005]|uniref:endo-1,4-beta-xylanase n=1 Tax=Butyrivibrio sp. NC3005 TaxID=1280685 RepID=UPI00041360C5|nr:endo-1,4-beta-xylanase [Butyrivibrio sp. NC3005]